MYLSLTRASTVALAALILGCGGAHAVKPPRSLYTALDRAHCEILSETSEAKGMRCEGLPGYPLLLSESAGKAFVSVGVDGASRQAARQTLKAENTLFKSNATRTTIEWRFIIREDKPTPYAMIVRYFTRSGNRRGEVLVVTRITATEACHVAHIDAIANANAIVLARRIADKSKRLACKREPIRIGASGKSPM